MIASHEEASKSKSKTEQERCVLAFSNKSNASCRSVSFPKQFFVTGDAQKRTLSLNCFYSFLPMEVQKMLNPY